MRLKMKMICSDPPCIQSVINPLRIKIFQIFFFLNTSTCSKDFKSVLSLTLVRTVTTRHAFKDEFILFQQSGCCLNWGELPSVLCCARILVINFGFEGKILVGGCLSGPVQSLVCLGGAPYQVGTRLVKLASLSSKSDCNLLVA